MRTEYACPFCGLHVVLDEESRSVAHEHPSCSRFKRLMSKKEAESVKIIDGTDLHARLDVLGREVGRKEGN